jgi:hypothetical protein
VKSAGRLKLPKALPMEVKLSTDMLATDDSALRGGVGEWYGG